MSGFVSRAACHGRRPAPYVGNTARERPSLIGRLLKERHVARFIVAPDGYGKTSLALEYAETMFSWTHVFWVNAQSPCFIRDLDARSLSSECLAHDSEAALVVFDDLPVLEPHRVQAFSEEVDVLIAADCEVIVTCVPTCDMMGAIQPDRIRIGARDLLLDDLELDEVRSSDERARKPSNRVGAAWRVPSVAWATEESSLAKFAKSVLDEEMPSDLLFLTASTLVLQSGSFSDLVALGFTDKGLVGEVLDDYPHLGFDGDLDRFEAPQLSMEVLSASIKRRLAELTRRSLGDEPEELVYAWANTLIAAGDGSRACDLVRETCARRVRGPWMIGRVYDLAAQACFYPMFRISHDQDSCKGEMRVCLNAVEALCRMILGDDDGAVRCAKRHAFDLSAPLAARVCDLLIVARVGKGQLLAKANDALIVEAETLADDGRASRFDWKLLARAWRAGMQGPIELASMFGGVAGGAGRERERELCICASWLFGLLEQGQDDIAASAEVRACERFMFRCLKPGDGSPPDFFAVSAGLSFEEARNRGVCSSETGMLEASVLIYLRQAEMNVLTQRRLFEEEARAALVRRADWINTHPGSLTQRSEEGFPAAPKRSVPILSIHLFGHFEASLGDVPLDAKRFSRRNALTLLVLLAVNHGRDLSRDVVERAMWPQSTAEVAHKNYYSVWSNLRSALTLPDGTCPYLVRHRYGCRLEPRYVNSDVERFNDICRELLFGVPNVDKWSALFVEIDRDFSSELLPVERKNRLIVQARNEHRTRLVDSLVAATLRLIEIESPQWGIWFARAALTHDDTREDAYYALMCAQIASNQRTAAMMTFLTCRRVLSDRLGIDPSPEITKLYESILDAQ